MRKKLSEALDDEGQKNSIPINPFMIQRQKAWSLMPMSRPIENLKVVIDSGSDSQLKLPE